MCLGLSAESEGSDQAQVLDSAFSIPSLRVHLWVQFCDMAIFYPFGHRRLEPVVVDRDEKRDDSERQMTDGDYSTYRTP
jgi:hypothetical protein